MDFSTLCYDLINYLIICLFLLIFYGLIPFLCMHSPIDHVCDIMQLDLDLYVIYGSSLDLSLSPITYDLLNLH